MPGSTLWASLGELAWSEMGSWGIWRGCEGGDSGWAGSRFTGHMVLQLKCGRLPGAGCVTLGRCPSLLGVVCPWVRAGRVVCLAWTVLSPSASC